MNAHLRKAGLLSGLFGIVIVTTAAASAAISFLPESRVWVEGTSTVRSYSCEAKDVNGTLEGSGALDVAQLAEAVKAANIAISVADLECGNGTMNGHMRKALNVTQHANVAFRLTDYEVGAVAGSEAKVKMDGTLTIAGQARPVAIDAVATPASNGALRVKGSKEILMSEFGVRPPSLMMGTMKVADKVRINFDVVLRP